MTWSQAPRSCSTSSRNTTGFHYTQSRGKMTNVVVHPQSRVSNDPDVTCYCHTSRLNVANLDWPIMGQRSLPVRLPAARIAALAVKRD